MGSIESFITLAGVGLIAGFLFSMPVAGPISIFITSRALHGRRRYCYKVAWGAAAADLFYCFIAVYGSVELFLRIQDYIPYLLLIGVVFIVFVGVKVFLSEVSISEVSESSEVEENELVSKTPKLRRYYNEVKRKSGFLAGFFINFLNPTLLFTWLGASFIAISIASSAGLNTGSLNFLLDDNKEILEQIQNNGNVDGDEMSQESNTVEDAEKQNVDDTEKQNAEERPPSVLLLSVFYSAMLSLGTVIWFNSYAYLLDKYRNYVNDKILTLIVKTLGIILIGFGLYLAYQAFQMLSH